VAHAGVDFGRDRRQDAPDLSKSWSFDTPAGHLISGEALPVTMGRIDEWIARNHVLAIA
jgi:hypothetical protein